MAQPDQEAVQATANPLVVRSVHPVNDAGYGVVGKRALYAAKSVRLPTTRSSDCPYDAGMGLAGDLAIPPRQGRQE